MSITRALEDHKKSHCDENEPETEVVVKMKPGLHFHTLSLSLTLNNAFASLGDCNFLRTLNPKLP
jgi:hypothetical protein